MRADTPLSQPAPYTDQKRGPSPTTCSKVTIDWTEPPASFIDVGHSRVPYRTVGRGPDVLFIHGWPLHGATFRGLLPTLAPRFTCHLIDLPGAGFSEWGKDTPISIRDHAATVRRIIDVIGLERYAVVGHDSGGTIARWATAGDQRLAAMVLTDTEIPRSRPLLLRLYLALPKIPGGKLLFGLLMASRWVRRSRLVLGSCFNDPSFAEGEFTRLFFTPIAHCRRMAAGQMRMLETFDWRAVDDLVDVHRATRAPVQLIWGTDDPFFPLASAESMRSQFGGETELVTVEGGKLLVHEEYAPEVAAAMATFLERHLL